MTNEPIKKMLEYFTPSGAYVIVEYNLFHEKHFESTRITCAFAISDSFDTLKDAVKNSLERNPIDDILYIDPIVWKYL